MQTQEKPGAARERNYAGNAANIAADIRRQGTVAGEVIVPTQVVVAKEKSRPSSMVACDFDSQTLSIDSVPSFLKAEFKAED